MFSILNRALSSTITSFGNRFCLKMRSRLIKALNNRFYVKFMQLEIGLLERFLSFRQTVFSDLEDWNHLSRFPISVKSRFILNNVSKNTNSVDTQRFSHLMNVGNEAHPIKKVAITIDTSPSHIYTLCSCNEKVRAILKITLFYRQPHPNRKNCLYLPGNRSPE